MARIDQARFARALLAARRHLGESQSDFGRRLGVGRQSVARWEGGAAVPTEDTRAVIVPSLGDLPEALRVELDVSHGADPPPPLAPVPHAPSLIDGRAVMEAIVFRAAEELDLGPRGVRAALANALAEMDRRGVSVQVGCEALRGRIAKGSE